MATTNFLQFNPGVVNQETDSQYLADSQRAGGLGTGNIVPSPLLNKALYQASTFCAAFGQMMATKGYSTSEASVSALAAVLANILTEADQVAPLIVQGYSPTPTFNAAAAGGFQMNLTGNVTSSSISGVAVGQLIAFYFSQDGVGGRTVAYPAGFVGALQPDPAPNAVSIQLFRADLARTMRAVTPVLSNNGMFTGPLTAASIALTAGAAAGKQLVSNGTVFLAKVRTPTNVTGSRAAGTVYQNTSGAEMLVESTWQHNSAGSVSAYIGSTSGASQQLKAGTITPAAGETASCPISFAVPPGWYYKIVPDTPTLFLWWEYTYA